MGTDDEDGKDHEKRCRNHRYKDTPPPSHHLLLPPEKFPEEEQERELDADNSGSEERRDSILEFLAQYEKRDEIWRRTFQTCFHSFL